MKKGAYALICLLMPMFLLSCSAKSDTQASKKQDINTVVYSYEDGSEIYCLGGDEYDHILFKGNKICFRGYTGESIELSATADFPFSIRKKICTIESYSFAKERYIAFHAYLLAETDSERIRYEWINSSQEPIKEELFSVLDLNEKTEQTFVNYTALYEYCEQNGIDLGDRYICSPFKSEPEIVTPLISDYVLVKYPYDVFAVRKGQENLYFGKISDLQIKDNNVIAFQLVVPRVRYFPSASSFENADLDLKSPNTISFFRILFGFDDLFKGEIQISLD